MKKVLFLGMILVLLLVPTFAYADMGAPSFIVYSGYISNPYGAPYYNTTALDAEEAGKVPFQTKIICHYEYNENRFAFVLEGEDFSYDSGKTKYIDKYNVTIDDLTKYKLGDKEEVRTFENTIIYDMPTEAVEGKVLGMIPKETDVTVQAYQVDEEATGLWNDWSQWYYTSYDNINGWIKSDNFAFYYDNEDKEYITVRNLLTEEGTFVPMFTPVKEHYYYRGEYFDRGVFYYNDEMVKYDIEADVAGKVDNDDDYTYEVLFDGIALYEQANVKSQKVVDSVPVGTTLAAEYVIYGHAFETWMCVRYEGARAWMYIGDLYPYKNSQDAQKQYEQNKQTIENARANNWDWYDNVNYPTDVEGLKKYYEKHIEDGLIYAEEPIKESDATKKEEKINSDNNVNGTDEMTIKPDTDNIRPTREEGNLSTNEMIVLVVAIIGIVLVLVATMITIIVLVNRRKR